MRTPAVEKEMISLKENDIAVYGDQRVEEMA